MTKIEKLFTFTTKQEQRERTCCCCGNKTHRGDTVHHISQVGTMTTLCDDCFNKAKEKEQEKCKKEHDCAECAQCRQKKMVK